MTESSTKSDSLRTRIFASLIATLVLAVIHYGISQVIADPLASVISSAIGVTTVLVALRWRVINPYELFGSRYLDAYTGIVRVYPSLHHAFDDLRSGISHARRVDLLLHIGRREFGDRDSLFTATLRARASESDFEVRILHIDEESPYLSEQRAQLLGKRRTKWLRDVHYVRAQIDELCVGHDNLRVAAHKEPFVWRLFVFDNEMFVSGYLHSTRNDEHAPVFKVRAGANSLYPAFRAYYDHLWQIYGVQTSKSAAAPIATA